METQTLRLDPIWYQAIKEGVKTSTIRLGIKDDVHLGSCVLVFPFSAGNKYLNAKIFQVRAINREIKHPGFSAKLMQDEGVSEGMFDCLMKYYYGEDRFNNEKFMTLIRWKLEEE